MSQERIISLLKRHYKKYKDRWFTAKDIQERLSLANSSVTKNLRGMRGTRLLRYRIKKNSHNINEFQYRYRVT